MKTFCCVVSISISGLARSCTGLAKALNLTGSVQAPIHHLVRFHILVGATLIPAPRSAALIDLAFSTAPGVSPCIQIVWACKPNRDPS